MRIVCSWLRALRAWCRTARALVALVGFAFLVCLYLVGVYTGSVRAQEGVGGAVIDVPAGSDLQAALDRAAPGDTLILEAGATYVGNFVLRAKSGEGVITILGSAHNSLPGDDLRVSPEHAVWMPKLVTPNNQPVIRTENRAHDYRFAGIEFHAAAGIYVFDLIALGSPSTQDVEQLPYNLEFDRVYVHGDSNKGGKRGIGLNSRSTVVKGSYFTDFKSDFQDAQCVGGWNGPGPYEIVNNHCEASGEGILFGGAAPSIQDLVPSDIAVYNNHITRPLAWKGKYRIKNLLELKSARNVDIRFNVFENNWIGAQSGIAILFTVRTCEGGDHPWSVVENVTFSNNVVRNAEGGGTNILGRDDARSNCGTELPVAGQTSKITIRDNLFENIRPLNGSNVGRLFQILSGAQDIVIEHNTGFQGQHIILASGAPTTGLVFRDNIVPHNAYGIFGDAKGSGKAAIDFYFPGSTISHNVIVGAGNLARLYPRGNFFPASMDDIRFVDLPGKNYALSRASRYKGAGSDDRDPGADMAKIARVLQHAVAGTLNPDLTSEASPRSLPRAIPKIPSPQPRRPQ